MDPHKEEAQQAKPVAPNSREREPMRRVSFLILAVLTTLAGYVVGRRSRDASTRGEELGPVVVRFAGNALHSGGLEAEIRAQPDVVRVRLATPEGRKEYVEELVRVELLARKGEEKGYHRNPDFLHRYKQEIAGLYLEKDFEQAEKKRAPTEAEVRKYFDNHRAESSRPERARAAVIAFFAEDATSRLEKRALAQATLLEVKRRASDYYAFGNIARLKSEDPKSRSTDGELPFLGKDELSTRLGPELAEAVFGLDKPGALHDRVVDGAKGFYVVKLLGRAPAYEPKFEDVRDSIQAKLTNERREAALKKFMDQLWSEAHVEIDSGALSQLKF
jgi:peptidyl-prolyl cis-trans isomerase C